MRRVTVVQLLPALASGGVERSTLEITEALVRAGHRAIVVSAGGRLLSTLQQIGGEHIALDIGRKSPWTLRHVGALRRLFMQERVNIVHARSRFPAWLGWLALCGIERDQRPAFVTTVHGLNSPSRYSAIMAKGDRVICVSGTVRDYVLRHYPQIDPGKLRVIPRGIDTVAFPRVHHPDAALREQLASEYPALAGNGPLLLLPGRGTRLKGHADALALLAALRRDDIDARLWMLGTREAGRDRYIADLEQQSASLGVAGALAITPPTAKIAEAYAACDLVLQLSRKPEAFGRTVIEALSVGRPVVGWAHGGVGELLHELQPQGAVTPLDIDALIVAAKCQLERAMLAQPPAPPATMPYTLHAMQDATLAVYDELVSP